MVSHRSCIHKSVTSDTYTEDVQMKTQFVFGLLHQWIVLCDIWYSVWISDNSLTYDEGVLCNQTI